MELNLHPKFLEAAQLVVSKQMASTAFLQRSLGLGFNSASLLMDQLEAAGLVSPAAAGNRQVLVSDLSSISGIIMSLKVDAMVKKIEEINARYQKP